MEILGMPVEVGLVQFVVAQVFGVACLAFNFWSYQKEDQRQYIGRSTIASALWLGMHLMMRAQLPIVLVAIASTVRGILFWWSLGLDSPFGRMFARRVMYVTLVLAFIGALAVIPTTRPETVPFQVLLAITGVLFIVGQYMPGIYLVRVFAVFYAIAVLLLNTPLDTFNPIGIVIEANHLIAIAVFFFAYARRRRWAKRLAAIPPKALALGIPVPGQPALT